jgi:hypothetical protein
MSGGKPLAVAYRLAPAINLPLTIVEQSRLGTRVDLISADKGCRAMKRAQLLGVAIAGVCGLGAFFGVMSLVRNPTKVVREEVTTNTTQVLVAGRTSGSVRP